MVPVLDSDRVRQMCLLCDFRENQKQPHAGRRQNKRYKQGAFNVFGVFKIKIGTVLFGGDVRTKYPACAAYTGNSKKPTSTEHSTSAQLQRSTQAKRGFSLSSPQLKRTLLFRTLSRKFSIHWRPTTWWLFSKLAIQTPHFAHSECLRLLDILNDGVSAQHSESN